MIRRLAVLALVLLGGAMAMLVVARHFFVGMSRVPQNGMYPTIRSGSLVLWRMHPYARIDDVAHGDIVLLNRAVDGATYLYVWRVIGLPGDRVSAAGDSLSLNGAPLKRERLRDEGGVTVFREAVAGRSYEVAIAKAPLRSPPGVDLRLGADELFVMGDNRYNAVDSRYFGPIKFATIIGRRF